MQFLGFLLYGFLDNNTSPNPTLSAASCWLSQPVHASVHHSRSACARTNTSPSQRELHVCDRRISWLRQQVPLQRAPRHKRRHRKGLRLCRGLARHQPNVAPGRARRGRQPRGEAERHDPLQPDAHHGNGHAGRALHVGRGRHRRGVVGEMEHRRPQLSAGGASGRSTSLARCPHADARSAAELAPNVQTCGARPVGGGWGAIAGGARVPPGMKARRARARPAARACHLAPVLS